MRFKEGQTYVTTDHYMFVWGTARPWDASTRLNVSPGQIILCTAVRVEDDSKTGNHRRYFYRFLVGERHTDWIGFKRKSKVGLKFREYTL